MESADKRIQKVESVFESLEERVLFDGVPDAGFVLPSTGSDAGIPAQLQNLDAADPDVTRELIIVDAGVQDRESLLADILEQKSGSAIEIGLLSADEDGIQQITRLLAEANGKYDAVHILSHGDNGEVQLGNSSLNGSNFNSYANELVQWSEAFTDDADLFFYGCNLAGDSSGVNLMESISAVTGADVAASTDVTGDAQQGGDWSLEFVRGDIQNQSLTGNSWQGILAVEATDGIVTVQDAENSGAGTVTLSNNGAPNVVTVLNTPTRVGQMLETVWQFNETADVGRSTFVFDVSGIPGINATIASEFGLIVSDQPDLADGPNTTTLVASGYDAANGLVFFHQVDLSDGDYFGLATDVVQDNFSINPTATGLEDTPIDLGLTLSPSLTDGGQLQDIIAAEAGFRDSMAGTTSSDFFIPAGTTGIRITGFSTRDIGTGATDTLNDDYQFLNASIDLLSETSNGYIGHIIDQGPNRSDQFAFEDAPLGASVLTGGGTIVGDANDNIDPTFNIVNGVLQITENHQLQTAYHVEFLTNATSSAEFIRTESAVLESGDQSLATLTIPPDADFLVVNVTDAQADSNFAIEYKGNSRVYIDLATLRASGVVAAQQGETDDRVVSYAFEDYDVSSAGVGSILSAAGTVVGDTGGQATVINDNQIYIDANGDLVIDRNDAFASDFNSLVTVEYYDRRDAGSSAEQLGESSDYGLFNSDPSNPISTLEFDIPENATLGIFHLTFNGTGNSDTNENSGAAFAVIDLVNETSSGSIYFVRTSNIADLVGFDSVPFGTAFFDDPNSISNHTTLNQFNDPFGGTAEFNLINGGTTLEFAANSDSGGNQSFLDYFAGGQIEWFGAAPFEISGFANGGTFSQGTFNPATGNWELTIAQAQMGLAFIPPTHVSGNMPVDVTLRIGDESEITSVTVQAVIDPIDFSSAPHACGHEDTDIPISANVTPTFIDMDGSETLTSQVLSSIPIGHTLTDGTNVFVSTAANQSVDITAWDTTAITYRANPDEFGTFTITMDVDWQDVGGGVTDTDSLTTTFDVEVKPLNDPPVAVDDFYTVLGNTTLNIPPAAGVLNNDSDVDGDMLTVNPTPVSGPSNGTLTLNPDGSFTYTPATGFSGTDSFVYEVSDGNGGTTTATAFIDVSEPVTGPLDAMDDMVVTNEETLINIDVMNNDDLPFTGAFNIQSTTPPSNGSITVLPDGTIDYTPDPNFFGIDTFTYTLADASGRTSTATVTVTVLNVQDPPIANADSGSTPEDTTLSNINILANDSDPDNDMLTVTMATAANGTVVINADGTIDYTPNPGFNGTDTVNYTISDGNGGFASTVVLINVVPVADPPTSADNKVVLDEDTSYTFVLGDFAFADQDPLDSLVAIRIDTLPAAGQLLFQGNPIAVGQVVSLADITNGRLIFVPDPDGFGLNYTAFDFSVSDGVLFQTAPNTQTIHVNPLQDPPVATDNVITALEESTGNPLGLAPPTDVDGDVLTVTVTGLPTLGTIFLADGVTPVNNGDMLTVAQLTSLVYDAPTSYDGVTDPGDFTYDVTDGIDTDSGVVDIILVAVNDPPEICIGAVTCDDFADTFLEGGSPIGIVDPSVGVTDEDDTTFPAFKIDIDQSTIVDAGQEFLTIAGVDFQLDAVVNSTSTVNVGGVNYDVTFDATNVRLDIVRSDAAEMTAAEIEAILLSTTYRNDAGPSTAGDRVFDFCVDDGDDLSNIATSVITVAREADLVTTKTLLSGDSTPEEGDTVTFQILVSNAGTAVATNVSLIDQMPAGITLSSFTASQGAYNSVTGLWNVGTIGNAGTATLTLTGTVDVGQGGNTITNTTTAATTTDQTDPTTAGDDLTETVTIENFADLVTVKTLLSGDSTPAEGDTVTFQIEVTNNGAAQVTSAWLMDQMPAGITLTSFTASQGSYNSTTGLWGIGTLNNSASATLTLTGTVDVGQGGNTITNTTTDARTPDQDDPTTAGDDLTESVTVENLADLVTVKTLASGDSTPAEGDTVTFEIEVINNGAAQATTVWLMDQLPAGITLTSFTVSQGSYNSTTGLWGIGTLNNSASATLTLTGTVDVGQGGNTLTNTTTEARTPDQDDPTTAGDDLTESIIVENLADLVTAKTLISGDSTPEEGDTVTFQIEVTNNGTAQATNVSLIDQLPAGLSLASFTASQGTYNSVTGLWSIGTLNNSGVATLTLTGTVDVGQGGNTITNVTTAATTPDQDDPTTAGDDLTESITVENFADLVTAKTLISGGSTPEEGDTVTFQIEVTNNGTAQTTNVSLIDQMPSGITLTSFTATQGAYNSGTGLWSIGTLNNAGVATLTLTGTVDVGQGGNTITNVTTAATTPDQDDPTTAGDDLTESITVENFADLVTAKTLVSGDSTPAEGDTVTFEIEVTNNGAAQATNISLTDQMPAGLTLTSFTISQGAYNSATGLWNIGTLSNAGVATLTLTGTVDVGQGGNTITNVTTAATTPDQDDPTTVGDDLTESITVDNFADLVTAKTLVSGDSTPAEGDTVTFEIEVTNNGAAQATNISLTDQMPAGLTLTSFTASQGAYNSVTGLWSIGTLNSTDVATLTLTGTVDVGQGGNTITNTTTAAATPDQTDPTTAGDDLSESVTIDNFADLVTVKTLLSGDSTPEEGDTVTFQIEVTNNGAAQVTTAWLMDQLPHGITLTSFTASQGSYNSTTGLWGIGTINNGASATLTLTGTVDVGQGGNTITNTTTDARTPDQDDPTTAGDDLTESIIVENFADLVTVKTLVTGDSTPEEGDTVTFEIEVTNNGTAQTTNVTLIDQMPSGITLTSFVASQGTYNSATGLWNIGTLNNSGVATLTLTGTVDVGQGGNTLTNTTTAAATPDQDDPTTTGDDLTESITVENFADLVTAKTLLSGDSTPEEGDTVTFEIEVTNNGTAQTTNVSLIDQMPSGITLTSFTATQGAYNSATGLWNIGTLNNAGVATLTLTGTVDVGQGGNTITNVTTAAATPDQDDPTTAGDDLTESITIENFADLVTAKTLTSGDSTPEEGDTVTFEIEVTNNGTAQTTNVSLIDQMPSGITLTSFTATQGAYNSATGLWNIGTLNNAGVATLTLTGTVDVGQGGNTITNVTTAATTPDQDDPTTAGDDLTESITVDNFADLVTAKTLISGDSTPEEGDTVTFEIEVTNNGAAQATNISLTDQMPAGLTLTSFTASQGVYNSVTGLWNIGTLNENGVATLTLTGTVDVGQGGNTITNTTTAALTPDQDDPTTAGDDLTETVTIENFANLVTVKTLLSGDTTPEEGDTVTFEIEVTNNGAAQATNVSLTDLMPAGITLLGATSTAGTYNSGNGLWLIGTLNSGDSATLVLTGTVDVGEGGNTITNTTSVAVTPDQIDPTTVGDDLTETVTVENFADLVTRKTLVSGDSTPNEGETVTFQIEVTNNGAAQTTNVSLVDQIPTGITLAGHSASQGTYNAVTGLWSIGTLNDGATAILTLTGTVDAGFGGSTITNTTTAATTPDQIDPTTAGDDLVESVVAQFPELTVEKAATSVVVSGDNFDVTFELSISNTGTVDMFDINLIDDLATQFGPALVGVVSTSIDASAVTAATPPTLNGSFNGSSDTNLLGGDGTLAVGDVLVVTLVVTVDPDASGSSAAGLANQATASGDDPDGDQFSDLSDDVGDPNSDDDPTVIAIPDLATAKSVVGSPVANGENFDVTFEIILENTGTVAMTGIDLFDNLAAQFGPAFVGLSGSPTLSTAGVIAGTPPTLNSGYDGVLDANLLGNDGVLQAGDFVAVTLTVTIDPDATGTSSTLTNQAIGAGDDPSGNETTDASDSGSDPNSNNGSGTTDDPTPISIADLSVGKQSNDVFVTATTGVFDAQYAIIVENTGTVDLANIQVTDDLFSEFGPSLDSILSPPTITSSSLSAGSSVPVFNGSWDGGFTQADLFDGASGLLAAGDSFTLVFTIRIDTNLGDPGPNPDFTNQILASGDDPSGNVVNDLSDDGLNPNSDNGIGGTNDVTPLLIPQIRASKSHGIPVSNADGTWVVPVTIEVFNTGTVPLSNLTLYEDIAAEFGNAFVSVKPPTISAIGTFTGTLPTVNSAWSTSNTSVDLLDPANTNETLEVDEGFRVTFTVVVDPDAVDGISQPLNNQATVTGDGLNFDGNIATAHDQTGEDSLNDPAGVDNDTPTELEIPELRTTKEQTAVVANGDDFDVTFEVVLENTGTVELTGLDLFDDLASQFGPAFVSVVSTSIDTSGVFNSTPPTLNANYDGATDVNLLGNDGLLRTGEFVVVTVTVTVDPNAGGTATELQNQAMGAGDAPSGNETTDLSDSGSDPNSNNIGEPGDTGGQNDPTPIEIPDLRTAKSVVGSPVENGNNWDVTFEIVLENTGTVELSGIDLFDDLASQLGDTFVGVNGTPTLDVSGVVAGVAPTLNSNFDGDTDINLLNNDGVLKSGESVRVLLTVTIDPDISGTSDPLFNQATGAGDDRNGDEVSDLSDSGTDANGDNGNGTFDDPTPIEIPDLSSAKSVVGGPVANGDNFDVTFEIFLENTGTVDLVGIDLFDDLTNQLGDAFVGLVGVPTLNTSGVVTGTAPTLNLGFDGDTDINLLGNDGVLKSGDFVQVTFTITIDPDAGGSSSPLENQVVAAGDDPSGNETTDNSLDGTDPNNPGSDGTFDGPTPIAIPDLATAKSVVGQPVANGDNWDVTFEIVLENIGTVDLNGIDLFDDLDAQLGNAFVGLSGTPSLDVSGATSGVVPTLNANFNGSSDINLLNNDGVLGAGDFVVVTFTVTIDPDATSAVLQNQAIGAGDDPRGNEVTDASDAGTDPNGNNGDGTLEDPTLIAIADLGLAKSVVGAPTKLDNGNFNVTYELVVRNTGTVDLANLSLVENLSSQFGSAFVSAQNLNLVFAPTDAASSIVLDAAWDGSGVTEMVDGSATSFLAVGDSFTLQFDVEIDGFGIGSATLLNSIDGNAEAVDENGAQIFDASGNLLTATDSSDSGNDPAGSNSDAPGDEGTSDDPTPLILPSIGLAKSAGDPVANGEDFDVTFTILFENTGNVDLNNLTIFDDLASEFGAALVGISNVSVQNFAGSGTAPAINGGWSTDTTQSIVSGGRANVGDSFEIVFTATIDPDAAGQSLQLVNQATAAGAAVDALGNPVLTADGILLTASDVSDNGTNSSSENGEANADGIFGNDPTPIYIADLGVAKSIVAGPTEVTTGIYSVTYRVAVENTGTVDLTNLSLIEDVAGHFGAPFIDATNLVLISGPTDPTSSIALNVAGFNGASDAELVDTSAINVLQTGDSFVLEFDVEFDATLVTGILSNQIEGSGDAVDEDGNPILLSGGDQAAAFDLSDAGFDPGASNLDARGDTGESDDPTIFDSPDVNTGASGNPPRLPGLTPISTNLLSNLLGTPSTIYSGSAVDPLSLESGRAVMGGYFTDANAGRDCGCPEPINPCCQPVEETSACDAPISEMDEVPHQTEIPPMPIMAPVSDATQEQVSVEVFVGTENPESPDGTEAESEISEESKEPQQAISEEPRIDRAENRRSPSFLKRFSGWLRS